MAKREGFNLHKFTSSKEEVTEDRAEDRDNQQQLERAHGVHFYQCRVLNDLYSTQNHYIGQTGVGLGDRFLKHVRGVKNNNRSLNL